MGAKLEIYKMASEMAERVSARRMVANGFFLTLNTTLVGILAFSYEKVAENTRAVLIFMSAVGIVIALAWFFSIRSYKRLNRAKFQVINEMEKDLPYQNFTDEWNLLKRQTAEDIQLKGFRKEWLKFKDRYTDLTSIEAVVPILFGVIYTACLLGAALGIGIK
jgi:hypothetical protein